MFVRFSLILLPSIRNKQSPPLIYRCIRAIQVEGENAVKVTGNFVVSVCTQSSAFCFSDITLNLIEATLCAGRQSILLTSATHGARQYLFDEVLDECATQSEATAACCAQVKNVGHISVRLMHIALSQRLPL